MHHGVRITDAALVAAATLSRPLHRRPLPARQGDRPDRRGRLAGCASRSTRCRTELDEVERRIVQLEIEHAALAKETDAARRERRDALERELAELREERPTHDAPQLAGREGRDRRRSRELKEQHRAGRAPRPSRPSATATCSAPPSSATATCPAARAASSTSRAQRSRELQADGSDAEGGGRRGGHRRGRRRAGPASRSRGCWRARCEKLVHMEERLHERVVGQDEASTRSPNAVRRARAGLQDPNRPIGSFLFLGPTGVGKTELARALAEFLFDDEHAMVRLDMSEYMEKHAVVAADRRAARLRRLRGGRPADRGRPPPAVLRGPARRDREGAPRRVQHPAAGARRRPPHRRPGPHRRLPQHGRDHDLERRARSHRRPRRPGGRCGAGRGVLRDDVPARVPEPHRRDRDLPPARRASRSARSSTCSSQRLAQRLARAARSSSSVDRRGHASCSAERGLRPGLRRAAAEAGRSSGWLENPLALRLLEGRIADGDRVVVEADGDELTFAPAPVEPVALEA